MLNLSTNLIELHCTESRWLNPQVRWISFRGHNKPRQERELRCAIYFPGGMDQMSPSPEFQEPSRFPKPLAVGKYYALLGLGGGKFPEKLVLVVETLPHTPTKWKTQNLVFEPLSNLDLSWKNSSANCQVQSFNSKALATLPKQKIVTHKYRKKKEVNLSRIFYSPQTHHYPLPENLTVSPPKTLSY